jgi:hypothetical protein
MKKLMSIVHRIFGRKAELVNTTPSIDPVEDCPSELFNSLLVATHVARNFGTNAKFMTFSECGLLDVPQGFHVYDWADQGVYGLSIRTNGDDGGVIYCAATDEAWFLGFVKGFRESTGVPPVVHTDDADFVARFV